jgi:type I restriction-modification system DNA methylase subunit
LLNQEVEFNQLLNLLDNFTWLCIITERKYHKYDEMLMALQGQSRRFPYINRKHEFEQIILKKDNLIDIEKLIILVKKFVDTIKLNSLIEDFNMRLKSDPKIITEFGNHLKENKTFKKMYGEVFTPIELIDQMLDKLPPEVWLNPDFLWADPACGTGNFLIRIKERLMESLKAIIPDSKEREKHILTNMLYGCEIAARNCVLTCLRLDYEDKIKLNIICADSLKFDFWGLKFNVVVGNPPYNSGSGNKGAGNILWDKFVAKADEYLVKDNGYICFVHPSLWRKPNHTLQKHFVENNLQYLEIHDEKDGSKIF